MKRSTCACGRRKNSKHDQCWFCRCRQPKERLTNCQQCGGEIARRPTGAGSGRGGHAAAKRLKGTTDPRAPEVDHIIALALRIKGHTWDNVQTLCRECNGNKGARALGQLRLAI